MGKSHCFTDKFKTTMVCFGKVHIFKLVLVAPANKVCGEESRKSPALVILKKKFRPVLVKPLGGTFS